MSHQANGAAALEQWLRAAPGGYLHPHVHIVADEERGLHWRAEADIAADTKLITTPHALALSYLNALVDDAYPVFKQRRKDFTVEAIGFFYLMMQHIHKSTSFWKPYLDTLPLPTDTLTTPLWFDEETTSTWLAATDVLYTMNKRKAVYEEYYASGKAILEKSGIDTTQFSWDYFKWSVTMFTSRSFSSRSIAPSASKYWTTYKTGRDGQRQTVLLDMSHTSAADLDFSVLFPAIDAGNHNHTTRVHWDYDPGRFSITNLDSIKAGDEVYNTYGPKSNGELLQGYGFCIENNPNDVVLLTVRAPPEALQCRLRETHQGYFDTQGQWLPEKATFELARIPQAFPANKLFDVLSQPLIELLFLVIRTEQGFEDAVSELSFEIVQRYRPHVARVLSESLTAKLARLSAPPAEAATTLQGRFAQIYHSGQTSVIRSYIRALQTYTMTLLSADASPVRLLTLGNVLSEQQLASAQLLKDFMKGIELNSNTAEISQLRAAGWEADIWMLLLCSALLSKADNALPAMTALVDRYDDNAESASDMQQATDLLAIAQAAAERLPTTIWSHPGWNANVIARAALIAQNELFQVLLTSDDEPALVLCVPHAPGSAN